MKFPECESCLWAELNPDVCDDCEDADKYEPNDDSEFTEGIVELKSIVFVPRHMEIVNDPDEGLDYLIERGEKLYG